MISQLSTRQMSPAKCTAKLGIMITNTGGKPKKFSA
uniref:Uncharacterized protein n=1 Tax=Anguilla anguilla TaxID=7936 RepID=A0A0E9UMY4_ANGAN